MKARSNDHHALHLSHLEAVNTPYSLLQVQVRRQLATLQGDALPALRDTLLQCACRSMADVFVLTQLLAALAVLAIQWSDWSNILPDLGAYSVVCLYLRSSMLCYTLSFSSCCVLVTVIRMHG